MCVLTRREILKEIESGRLQVDPFDPGLVGPASIDLHLGTEIRVPAEDQNGPLHLREDPDPDVPSRVVRVRDFYVLEPGQTVHGITREHLSLPPDLCGWLEGRSCLARIGLMIHVTAGFVHPGVCNHQVLEMSNVSRVPLALHPGLRVCQIVLERTEGEAVYAGRFADQDSP